MELLDAGTEALLIAAKSTGPDRRPLPWTSGDWTLVVRIAHGASRESGSPTARGRQPWVTSSAWRPSPQSVGYMLVESRARLLRSAAVEQSGSGSKDRAVTEARGVFERMSAIGAVTLAAAARRRLAELGVEVAPATEVGVPNTSAQVPTSASASGSAAPASMAPEERLVTVLFVDIRGYTAFAGDAVPESLATRVAAFHRWARAEIEAEGGLVDKFAGDAVMATFNVVSPRLDHAPAALRAAIGIRDKAAAGGFSVGGGIAVGPAVVGALVAGGNVSAIGTPTNLAARLQAQASGGRILLSGEAYRRIATWLHERGLTAQRRDLELKGFDGPVEAWEVAAKSR